MAASREPADDPPETLAKSVVRRKGADRAHHPAATSWGAGRLYWYDEVPEVLAYNQFVRSGYRAGLSYPQCCRSIFQYHNETGALSARCSRHLHSCSARSTPPGCAGNIWSHLLPGATVLAALATGHLEPWEAQPTAFWESTLPILLCFACSVAYHTLMAHQQHYKCWILLDVLGIFVIFVASMHRSLLWGFPCQPLLFAGFTAVYYATALAAAISAAVAKTAVQRGLPMLGLLLVRLAALGTRIALRSGSQAAIAHYVVMETLSIVGATVNVLRLPERWLHKPDRLRTPNPFDYWLNSHQLMHLLVVVALLNMHLGSRADHFFYSAHLEQSMCDA